MGPLYRRIYLMFVSWRHCSMMMYYRFTVLSFFSKIFTFTVSLLYCCTSCKCQICSFIIMCMYEHFVWKGHPRNDLYCVGWDVKAYTLTQFTVCFPFYFSPFHFFPSSGLLAGHRPGSGSRKSWAAKCSSHHRKVSKLSRSSLRIFQVVLLNCS